MYFPRAQLSEAISTGDKRLRNFLETFGFIVIRDFLNAMEFDALAKKYDAQYDLRMPDSAGDGMRFLPNFVDSSASFTNFFFSDSMQEIYRYFAGEQFLYLGSDGSRFITTSFPWHRDWFTRMPILKMNFYFNRSSFEGGKFMVIPGSNYAGDAYAANIQKAMSWPMPNKNPGGLNENGWLPETRNYRADLHEQLNSALQEVPHVELRLGPGDVVIFDHRAAHCVQTTDPPITRDLLTILLSQNAFEFPDDHRLLKTASREDLMREIVDLVVSERNHIGCEAWGDAIRQHPFSKSRHFINIAKSENSAKFDVGYFTDFTSVLDFDRYAKIGKAYREKIGQQQTDKADALAQNYGYDDVHLGINAQNMEI